MPFRSRLHEAGHVRDGRGARTENSRSSKTVACAVLSAGSLRAATKSAEDSGRYRRQKRHEDARTRRQAVRTPKASRNKKSLG